MMKSALRFLFLIAMVGSKGLRAIRVVYRHVYTHRFHCSVAREQPSLLSNQTMKLTATVVRFGKHFR